MGEHWGWASPVGDFLSTPLEKWRSELTDHHHRLFGFGPSDSQIRAWNDEYAVMAESLKACVTTEPDSAAAWSVIFEYELPMEGGRRPDVVVLTGTSVVVLEFKSVGVALQSDIDQTIGYVRDLEDYHSECAGVACTGLLVLVGGSADNAQLRDGIAVVGRHSVPRYLFEAFTEGFINLESWLWGTYRPLPTLVEAARKIFRDEDLPHVRTAIAAGIPETVEKLGMLIDESSSNSLRMMAFVTGVPGAGKTLVGLRLVYERTQSQGNATFLSGNGPLVQVLQDALSSRVFVRDLHAFIRTYALGTRARIPDEHVVVFDEAQRAWDKSYMYSKKGVNRSEPELLVQIGEKIPDWSALVGLVGEGQEIHSGEEGGMSQWRKAVADSTTSENWIVHCPPKLKDDFHDLNVVTHEELDLNITLRSRRANDLHRWVRLLLEGSISLANQAATKVVDAKYPIYVTRSIDLARGYARDRFKGEPNKRFGLLASSHAKNLTPHGIDNSYLATSRMSIAKWFNAAPESTLSSNALIQPITEFGCQGLELDLPIVCWGQDMTWRNDSWRLSPIKRTYVQDDPKKLLRNAYRVLLTRGRDGLVIFLPPEKDLDSTEVALLAAGASQLTETI